jgi:hypothetical protein
MIDTAENGAFCASIKAWTNSRLSEVSGTGLVVTDGSKC